VGVERAQNQHLDTSARFHLTLDPHLASHPARSTH